MFLSDGTVISISLQVEFTESLTKMSGLFAVIVLSVLTGMSHMMVRLLSLLCIAVTDVCWYHLSVILRSWFLQILQWRHCAYKVFIPHRSTRGSRRSASLSEWPGWGRKIGYWSTHSTCCGGQPTERLSQQGPPTPERAGTNTDIRKQDKNELPVPSCRPLGRIRTTNNTEFGSLVTRLFEGGGGGGVFCHDSWPWVYGAKRRLMEHFIPSHSLFILRNQTIR